MKTFTNNSVKVVIATIVLFFAVGEVKAKVYTTVSDGNWTAASIWSPSKPNPSWGWTDTIIVNHDVNFNTNLTMFGVLIIQSGAELDNTGKNLILSDGAKLVNSGTININKITLDWGAQSMVNNGTTTLATSMIINEGSLVNNSVMSVTAGFTVGYGQSFTNGSSATLTVGGNLYSEGNLQNQGSISVTGNFVNDYDSQYNNSGDVTVVGNFKSYTSGENTGDLTIGGTFLCEGEFSNSSTIDVVGNITVEWECAFSNEGEISTDANFFNSGNMVNEGGTVTVAGSMTNYLTIESSGDIAVTGTFKNDWGGEMEISGELSVGSNFTNLGELENSGDISAGGTFLNDWSCVFNNSGNISSTGNVTNNGTFNNSGVANCAGDFRNEGTVNNTNMIDISGGLNNVWATIENSGILSVVADVTNSGDILNEGAFYVDGSYAGSGDVTGTGNLCHSDGVTDPTGGAKDVNCEICNGDGSPLPVTLVEFTAYHDDNVVRINWKTMTESNSDFFQVLASADGINFKVIATVDAAGNSNKILEYIVVDENPGVGINYYKLQQIDFDGKKLTSNLLEVNIEMVGEIMIYPNPVSLGEDIKVAAENCEVSKANIFDLSGKLVKSVDLNTNVEGFSTSDLSQGTYIIKFETGSQSITKRLMVK